MTCPAARFEVRLRPFSERFDDDDDVWLGQKVELTQGTEALPEIAVTASEQVNAKGLTESVIIALGSAGAFRAAVEFWRLWLARDRTRSIELTYLVDGAHKHIVVQGTGLGDDAFEALAKTVQAQLER